MFLALKVTLGCEPVCFPSVVKDFQLCASFVREGIKHFLAGKIKKKTQMKDERQVIQQELTVLTSFIRQVDTEFPYSSKSKIITPCPN